MRYILKAIGILLLFLSMIPYALYILFGKWGLSLHRASIKPTKIHTNVLDKFNLYYEKLESEK